MLIVAEEISTEQGHLLALQVGPHRYRFGPAARQAIADIHDEGGWALVAHGDHARLAWRGGWGGTDGLEVINLAAAWSQHTVLSGAVAVGASFIDTDHAAVKLLRRPWLMLRLWDSLVELSPPRRHRGSRRPWSGRRLGSRLRSDPGSGQHPGVARPVAAAGEGGRRRRFGD